MSSTAYITSLASFLPNEPVCNERIEEVLGMVSGKPSRSKKLVLRNNQIKKRYYAFNPNTNSYTYNNAQMAAEAVRAVSSKAGFSLQDLQCLCAGTSSPDLNIPAHGFMVHGELESPPCEVFTSAAVCTSSIAALKFAMLNVAAGLHENAISVGSEFSSRYMRGNNFEPEMAERLEQLSANPELSFEKDFLRWMLSDGAGAALVQNKPNENGLSLAIDWIEQISYANENEVCMYSGGIKDCEGQMMQWHHLTDPMDLVRKGYHALKQDARILNENIVTVSVDKALTTVAKRRNLDTADIDWFLPHYSSEYFRPRLQKRMEELGFAIPQERWFTNLHEVGNIGSASMYVMLDALMNSGRLKKGDRILCFIPESARFNVCYMHLTVA